MQIKSLFLMFFGVFLRKTMRASELKTQMLQDSKILKIEHMLR